MRSWARRSLAAATSFMARVIFCVDWTERIRRWISRSVAISRGAPRKSPPYLGRLDAFRRHELGLGVGDGLRERVAQGVRDFLLVADLGQDLRLLALEPAVE